MTKAKSWKTKIAIYSYARAKLTIERAKDQTKLYHKAIGTNYIENTLEQIAGTKIDVIINPDTGDVYLDDDMLDDKDHINFARWLKGYATVENIKQ